MIPFILIAAGSYFVYDAFNKPIKKLSLGDYLPDKSLSEGDEIVLKFKEDSWLELYEKGEEYPSIEIPFQAGETFEITLFDIDDYQYHAILDDGSLAFIPKNEVEVVAVNDEVSSFASGGKVTQKKQERLAMLEELVSRYVKDPDDVNKEMAAYLEKGFSGFSDSVQANLGRDMDFITLTQIEHDEDTLERERGYAKGGKTKYWIKDAIKKKGALRATAKKEGLIKGDEKLSMTDLKKLEKKGGKTGQRARLAETLKKMEKVGKI